MGGHDGRQGVAGAQIVDSHTLVDFGRRIGLASFREHVRDSKPGFVVKRERRQDSLVGAQGAQVITISTKTTRLVSGLTQSDLHDPRFGQAAGRGKCWRGFQSRFTIPVGGRPPTTPCG